MLQRRFSRGVLAVLVLVVSHPACDGGDPPAAPEPPGAIAGGDGDAAMAVTDGGAAPDSEPAVAGRLLVAGTDLVPEQIVALAGESWVIFGKPSTPPSSEPSRTSEVRIVRLSDGGDERSLLTGRVARLEWGQGPDADGVRYYMTDEAMSPAGPIGTLTRVSLTEGIKETIPNVLGYAFSGDRRLFNYRTFAAVGPTPEWHMRDLGGRDRNLGPVNGRLSWSASQKVPPAIYFIAAVDDTFTRVVGVDGPTEPLRKQVSRYLIGGDKFAILTIGFGGAARDVIVDLTDPSKPDRPLAVQTSCCWIEANASHFFYSEPATAARGAVLHDVDLTTGADVVVNLPAGHLDVVSRIRRPASGDVVLVDSQDRLAVLDASGTFKPLAEQAKGVAFSPEGKALLYVVPAAASASAGSQFGQLFGQSAEDWSAPPRLVAPPAVKVSVSRPFFVKKSEPHPVVFGAQGARGVDILLGDLASATSVPLARSYHKASYNPQRFIVLRNVDPSPTRELAHRDFETNEEVVLGRDVQDYTTDFTSIVFAVRGASATSPRAGLWVASLLKP
jgi:hypothetical protein